MSDPVTDLLDFIDSSPSPYHAVANAIARLEASGFTRLSEADAWNLSASGRHYLTRGDGSILAFEMGTQAPAETGFRIVGAHTDSPNFRIKPTPDVSRHGYHQLAVETYGGVLTHTWLDRDLSIAGRVALASPDGPRMVLVDFKRPVARIASLAIHLDREIRETGVKLNPQEHLVPLLSMAKDAKFVDLLAAEINRSGDAPIEADDILSFDLMLYDTQAAALGGSAGELILASRLDNLASCHAGLAAFLAVSEAGTSAATRVLVLYDHEEVGSRSARGAGGPFLADVLERLSVSDASKADEKARALSSSSLVSADMAHAVHPNYAERHEPGHKPVLGAGPVIKTNVNQAYASDAESTAMFVTLARKAGVETQSFVARNDIACGSTLGPITATRTGITTVDVGNPMLSMHSCREVAAAADVAPMITILEAYLRS